MTSKTPLTMLCFGGLRDKRNVFRRIPKAKFFSASAKSKHEKFLSLDLTVRGTSFLIDLRANETIKRAELLKLKFMANFLFSLAAGLAARFWRIKCQGNAVDYRPDHECRYGNN